MSFIKNYGIEQSILEKCLRNITDGTPDFNVYIHPPYYRENSNSKNADTVIKNADEVIKINFKF